MRRRFSWSWIGLSLALFCGALWATSRTEANRTIPLLALLWIPLFLAVSIGTWTRWQYAGEMNPLSLPNRITAGVLAVVLFGGIDAWAVYGEAAWRPITAGIGIVTLLIGWTTDWSRIASTPIWRRPLRQFGYYGLTMIGLALIPFIESFQSMIFFMFAELLSPHLHERTGLGDRSGETEAIPNVQ